jgi:hypothetical protein
MKEHNHLRDHIRIDFIFKMKVCKANVNILCAERYATDEGFLLCFWRLSSWRICSSVKESRTYWIHTLYGISSIICMNCMNLNTIKAKDYLNGHYFCEQHKHYIPLKTWCDVTHHHFGKTFCLLLQGRRWRQQVPPKCR